MTEIELNEQLAALLGSTEQMSATKRRTGRQYRRRKGQEKSDRRLAIVQLSGYAPHRGYVDWVLRAGPCYIRASTSSTPRTASVSVG